MRARLGISVILIFTDIIFSDISDIFQDLREISVKKNIIDIFKFVNISKYQYISVISVNISKMICKVLTGLFL